MNCQTKMRGTMKHHIKKPAKLAAVLLSLAIAFPAYAAVSLLPQSHASTKFNQITLAQTDGMERRDERRDDRQDDRQDRRDDRQDCREEEGVVGKDKRDCKQDGRQERNEDG